MARPKKQTVDYFPHQCRHGKTIYILKEKYKHVGYAFWFTLLEELGSAEGHFIDCNNSTTMRFLQATTMTDEDLCNEILDLLAEIEAIDPELWKEKIIWSDNFVEGISSVYANRRVESPTKPSFYKKKHGRSEVSTCRNPHSKVKESKVDEIIVNKVTNTGNSVPNTGEHKRNYTKETIQKKLVPKGTEAMPQSVEYGNKEINDMIFALKKTIEIDDFADTKKWTRIYAKHCLSLIKKIGAKEFRRRLKFLLSDDFHSKNCNKIKYVYNQIKGFKEPKNNHITT